MADESERRNTSGTDFPIELIDWEFRKDRTYWIYCCFEVGVRAQQALLLYDYATRETAPWKSQSIFITPRVIHILVYSLICSLKSAFAEMVRELKLPDDWLKQGHAYLEAASSGWDQIKDLYSEPLPDIRSPLSKFKTFLCEALVRLANLSSTPLRNADDRPYQCLDEAFNFVNKMTFNSAEEIHYWETTYRVSDSVDRGPGLAAVELIAGWECSVPIAASRFGSEIINCRDIPALVRRWLLIDAVLCQFKALSVRWGEVRKWALFGDGLQLPPAERQVDDGAGPGTVMETNEVPGDDAESDRRKSPESESAASGAANSGAPDPRARAKKGDGFASIVWGRAGSFTFSPTQAAIVKCLWENWKNGTPQVHSGVLLEVSGSEGQNVPQLFKGNPAYKTVIVEGTKKGTYRLNDEIL